MNDLQQSITSDQNAKFKLWKSLLTTRNRKKESLFILSGEKIIHDFIADNGPQRFAIKAVLIAKNQGASVTDNIRRTAVDASPKGSEFTPSIKKILKLDDNRLFFTLDTLLFKELDTQGTDFPLLVCQRPDDVTTESLNAPVGLELGLPLTDPANLGALCRTALSFNVKQIILSPGACDPYHPKALRASSGATLKLNFIHHTSDAGDSSNSDYCLDLNGLNIYDLSWPKNLRLWLGEEGQGFKRTFHPKNKICIPIQGMESLNATVAGSIAIFSYSQAHKA
jgi:TrmH family RNA methyltransferase